MADVVLRALLALLGVASIAGGIAVAVVITMTWLPCADEIPFTEVISPECHELAADDRPLPWAWQLWPVAAVLAGLAIMAGALRGRAGRMRVALVALAVVTAGAFPILEYATLAGLTGAWDAAPWMGTGSAITAIFAGAVLLAASRRRDACDEG